MSPRTKKTVFTLLVLCIFAVGFYIAYQKNKTMVVAPLPGSDIEIKEYKDTKYGFSFSYQKSFTLSEVPIDPYTVGGENIPGSCAPIKNWILTDPSLPKIYFEAGSPADQVISIWLKKADCNTTNQSNLSLGQQQMKSSFESQTQFTNKKIIDSMIALIRVVGNTPILPSGLPDTDPNKITWEDQCSTVMFIPGRFDAITQKGCRVDSGTRDERIDYFALPGSSALIEVRGVTDQDKSLVDAMNLFSNTFKVETEDAAWGDRLMPGASACVVAGCSGQLCIDEGSDQGITTCEFKAEYACYKKATCERQPGGACGWTETSELSSCLMNPK